MPPTVFTRWMNVAAVNASPPVGPFSAPTTVSLSQATALGSTTTASSLTKVLAQTALVSRECSHVARIGWKSVNGLVLSNSSGLGLKKWVMSCLGSLGSSLNKVASGVNSVQANLGLPAASTPADRQT